ncbi:DnaJ C-terminal domain-containing protein [Sinorhizobium sp. BG8]|uniref:DnaJ C-terminal domain-containing protein n=1 Tax=Sinorhizobium sp. BG8 TaxID=2613773 RepID=UPI00193E5D90|nr:DnaJ C-terminal domain-containing protein [Sinorhizobium sp. BG8]QRM54557.1 DnaJ domain-containing protein [Sinorhizobium sp. BG8]
MRDPYSVLGLKRNANQDEIKAAWRSVAKAVHPDQNQDDPFATVRFTEAGRAYDLLRDPEKRSRYDRAQREAELRRMEQMRRQQSERKVRASSDTTKNPDESAEDMIARIFGVDSRGNQASPQAQAQPQSQPGTTRAEKIVDPKPAARTAPMEEDERPDGAPPAAGSYIFSAIVRRIRAMRAKTEKVPDLVREVTVSVEDLFAREKVTVNLDEDRTTKLSLAPGMTDGHVVRLADQGYRVGDLKRGDAVITLRVAPGRFRAEGFDLRTELPITIENAVLGCETTIDGLGGRLAVSVPAWSGSDRVIRIEGEGLPDGSGNRGDLLVEIRLLLGEEPNNKVIDLMRSLKEGLYL